jgi:hypothetical protein
MEPTSITFRKWRIPLANNGTMTSMVELTMRCNDIFAGPNVLEYGFTRYIVLNTETRKWLVEALVENPL